MENSNIQKIASENKTKEPLLNQNIQKSPSNIPDFNNLKDDQSIETKDKTENKEKPTIQKVVSDEVNNKITDQPVKKNDIKENSTNPKAVSKEQPDNSVDHPLEKNEKNQNVVSEIIKEKDQIKETPIIPKIISDEKKIKHPDQSVKTNETKEKPISPEILSRKKPNNTVEHPLEKNEKNNNIVSDIIHPDEKNREITEQSITNNYTKENSNNPKVILNEKNYNKKNEHHSEKNEKNHNFVTEKNEMKEKPIAQKILTDEKNNKLADQSLKKNDTKENLTNPIKIVENLLEKKEKNQNNVSEIAKEKKEIKDTASLQKVVSNEKNNKLPDQPIKENENKEKSTNPNFISKEKLNNIVEYPSEKNEKNQNIVSKIDNEKNEINEIPSIEKVFSDEKNIKNTDLSIKKKEPKEILINTKAISRENNDIKVEQPFEKNEIAVFKKIDHSVEKQKTNENQNIQTEISENINKKTQQLVEKHEKEENVIIKTFISNEKEIDKKNFDNSLEKNVKNENMDSQKAILDKKEIKSPDIKKVVSNEKYYETKTEIPLEKNVTKANLNIKKAVSEINNNNDGRLIEKLKTEESINFNKLTSDNEKQKIQEKQKNIKSLSEIKNKKEDKSIEKHEIKQNQNLASEFINKDDEKPLEKNIKNKKPNVQRTVLSEENENKIEEEKEEKIIKPNTKKVETPKKSPTIIHISKNVISKNKKDTEKKIIPIPLIEQNEKSIEEIIIYENSKPTPKNDKNKKIDSQERRKEPTIQSQLIKKDSIEPVTTKIQQRPSSHRISRNLEVIYAQQKKRDKKIQSNDVFKIRQSFQISLSKLAYNETRERGIKELKELISANTTQKNLRIFFSIIFLAKSDIPAEKEAYLLIVGFICSVYKENLIDPIDQPPELRKTVLKIIEYIHGFFSDNRGIIQKLCAKFFIDVYENNAFNFDLNTVLVLFYGPLVTIINTKNELNLVTCASLCLFEFVKIIAKKNEIGIMNCFFKEIPQIFKKKAEFSVDLIKSFSLLLDIEGSPLLSEGKTIGYIEKLLFLLSKTNKNTSTPIKIEACSCLEQIAKYLLIFTDEFNLLNNLDFIIETLYEISKDKDLGLKVSSTKCLEAWMKLIGNYNKDLEKYTSFYKFSNPVAPKSNSAWRDLRNIRTLFKLNKQENSEIPLKVESELPILKVPKDIKPQTQNITQNLFKKILDKNQNGFKKLPQKLQSKNQITDNETFEIENLPKNLNFLKNISEQQYPTNLKPQNDKILKKNPTNNFVNKDPLQNKDSDENFREYQKEEDFEPIKIEKDKINKKSGKHSENIRQLRAANFQRKKTGLGGGHIPNNNLIESKLSLLKEMIRKSIEKRPQSADPYQKMPEKTKFNYKKFPESSKPELNEIFADNNLNTDDEIFQIEEPIINNIDTTHSQQKDTRELFFQVYDPPSPRLPKNSVVRAPQNFKIPFFEQIHSKLEEELQKIPINKKTAVPLEMVKPANNDFKQNMDSWSQALFCLECDDIKGAYDVLLKKKDDIFLLRLMSKTGPCFEKMKEKTSMKVLNRILDLYKMNFIEKTCKSFFFEAKEENLLNSLNLDDKKFLMQIMDT